MGLALVKREYGSQRGMELTAKGEATRLKIADGRRGVVYVRAAVKTAAQCHGRTDPSAMWGGSVGRYPEVPWKQRWGR